MAGGIKPNKPSRIFTASLQGGLDLISEIVFIQDDRFCHPDFGLCLACLKDQLRDGPTSWPGWRVLRNIFVKSTLEGVKRELARPFQPKGHLSVDEVKRKADSFIQSSKLAHIRFLFAILGGYSVRPSMFLNEKRLFFIRRASFDVNPKYLNWRILPRFIRYFNSTKEFKKYVKEFVKDTLNYGLRSIKSGADSNPLCKVVNSDLLDFHAA
ncbi:uncharacterized protein LOC116601955 [Nematostella vectensis]|uniref:uncharacterized protein LOC116601955 n=1 Tax=Nematostella vectensis TaxID=45351 RepID=UPI0020775209|nr:uncharacterized protein LOC116601955 [Nematostella vectensis]